MMEELMYKETHLCKISLKENRKFLFRLFFISGDKKEQLQI